MRNEPSKPPQLKAGGVQPPPPPTRHLREDPPQMNPHVKQDNRPGNPHEAVSGLGGGGPAPHLAGTPGAGLDAEPAPTAPSELRRDHEQLAQHEEPPLRPACEAVGPCGGGGTPAGGPGG